MNTTWGIFAHVDAGKTTLSEAILFNAGAISSLGRVDHKDAFLDTDMQEKNRGITIFSKPAYFTYNENEFTLLDTPGHVDFALEAERAMWALDRAVLLINGADGVQSHTKTLFKLLLKNKIPTLIFINKIDQPQVELAKVLSQVKKELSDACGLCNDMEGAALYDEGAMEEFLENDTLSQDTLFRVFQEQKWFPVLTGSALKNTGVRELLDFMGIYRKREASKKDASFGARCYKIESLGRDTRLTFVKLTAGTLKVKETIGTEKVEAIRLYSGSKFKRLDEAKAGDLVALVGLKETFAGQGIGEEQDRESLSLTPVLEYAIEFLDGTDPKKAYLELLKLNEEDSSLHVCWDEKTEQIKLSLMGQVQTEILTERIKNELGLSIDFLEGKILYKETLLSPVEGVGHFEPLRHYAEAHIYMEPLPAGEGIKVELDCPTDLMALNWQRLIETHILEREHLGVLTGSPVTDIKFTVIGGRAHIKHTEGGDFREATYRAIRQGLMEAGTKLLEPYYNFEITVPTDALGRVMNDIDAMAGSFEAPVDLGGASLIKGSGPAINIRNYQAKLTAFTNGNGHIELEFAGFLPCHNEEEILAESTYDPESDTFNPTGSVFCSHGSGEYVPWNMVKDRCHVACIKDKKEEIADGEPVNLKRNNHGSDEWLDPDEIDKILSLATHNNQGKNPKKGWNYGKTAVRRVDSTYEYKPAAPAKKKDKYMLVDGYNLIYAWPELKAVLDVNLDGARGKLLDILSNYQATTDYILIAVFDAYKVKGHAVTTEDYQNIHQVFTAEAQTADAYIEKFSHENAKNYDVTVVTSDGLEQVIIRGAGARLISSREFIQEVELKAKELREKYDITLD